jgi:hypothetical protein
MSDEEIYAFNEGIKCAAKFLNNRWQAYVAEHGSYDYTTGVTEFSSRREELVNEWQELEEEILALAKTGIKNERSTNQP